MSDRNATRNGMKDRIPEMFNCNVILSQPQIGKSWRQEHGPFAGPGYWDDLALVSPAVDGLVLTSHSTSSMLLEEQQTISALQCRRRMPERCVVDIWSRNVTHKYLRLGPPDKELDSL